MTVFSYDLQWPTLFYNDLQFWKCTSTVTVMDAIRFDCGLERKFFQRFFFKKESFEYTVSKHARHIYKQFLEAELLGKIIINFYNNS